MCPEWYRTLTLTRNQSHRVFVYGVMLQKLRHLPGSYIILIRIILFKDTLFRRSGNNRQTQKKVPWALAGVVSGLNTSLWNQRVTVSIASQGTCLGWGPEPQLGVRERQPHIGCFSPYLSLSLFLKINLKKKEGPLDLSRKKGQRL